MIPIRYVIEDPALQGTVGWNAQTGEVNILCRGKHFTFKLSSPTVIVDGEKITLDVALRWFETNANGDLFYEYQDDYAKIMQFAQDKGIKTHASVVFMDRAGMHTLLSDPSKRQYLIAQLSQQVSQNNYDGVNIDFEYLGEADRDNFSQFLRELKLSLGDDKQLSVALFACTKPESWLTGYDYASIGEIVDRVIIMAYDYSYKGSPAGPVAPLWWVEEVVSYLKTIIPAEKMLLGLPTYGYDWGDGLSTTTVTAARLQTLKEQYNLTESFDNASMSP